MIKARCVLIRFNILCFLEDVGLDEWSLDELSRLELEPFELVDTWRLDVGK